MRNLDDNVARRSRIRAAEHGRSAEASIARYYREILGTSLVGSQGQAARAGPRARVLERDPAHLVRARAMLFQQRPPQPKRGGLAVGAHPDAAVREVAGLALLDDHVKRSVSPGAKLTVTAVPNAQAPA